MNADVLELDVAMDNALIMKSADWLRDLTEDWLGFQIWQNSSKFHQIKESAMKKLENDEEASFVVFEWVNDANKTFLVSNLRHELDFALKKLHGAFRRIHQVYNLDGDLFVGLLVEAKVDLRVAAFAEQVVADSVLVWHLDRGEINNWLKGANQTE